MSDNRFQPKRSTSSAQQATQKSIDDVVLADIHREKPNITTIRWETWPISLFSELFNFAADVSSPPEATTSVHYYNLKRPQHNGHRDTQQWWWWWRNALESIHYPPSARETSSMWLQIYCQPDCILLTSSCRERHLIDARRKREVNPFRRTAIKK